MSKCIHPYIEVRFDTGPPKRRCIQCDASSNKIIGSSRFVKYFHSSGDIQEVFTASNFVNFGERLLYRKNTRNEQL